MALLMCPLINNEKMKNRFIRYDFQPFDHFLLLLYLGTFFPNPGFGFGSALRYVRLLETLYQEWMLSKSPMEPKPRHIKNAYRELKKIPKLHKATD